MRPRILDVEQAAARTRLLHEQGKPVVLAGGCFDVLHAGHVRFLEKARAEGDALFVMLECDRALRRRKGPQRPINRYAERASVLAALRPVDAVVLLPCIADNDGSDEIVRAISPDVIAATAGDPGQEHKERQARLAGARLAFVTARIGNLSSTHIIQALERRTKAGCSGGAWRD